MILCRNCGSLLDFPRENPKTHRVGRKCPECLNWENVRPGEKVAGRVQQAIIARRRSV